MQPHTPAMISYEDAMLGSVMGGNQSHHTIETRGVAGMIYFVDPTTAIKVYSDTCKLSPLNDQFEHRGSAFNEMSMSLAMRRIFGDNDAGLHIKCTHIVDISHAGQRVVYKCLISGCSESHGALTRGIPKLGNKASIVRNTCFSIMERLEPCQQTEMKLSNITARTAYAANIGAQLCHTLAVMNSAVVSVPNPSTRRIVTQILTETCDLRETHDRTFAQLMHGDIKCHNIVDRVSTRPYKVTVVVPTTGETVSFISSRIPVLCDYGITGFITFPATPIDVMTKSGSEPLFTFRAIPCQRTLNNKDHKDSSDIQCHETLLAKKRYRSADDDNNGDNDARIYTYPDAKRQCTTSISDDDDDDDDNDDGDDATLSESPCYVNRHTEQTLASPQSVQEILGCMFNLGMDTSESIRVVEDYALYSTRYERSPEIYLLFILCAPPHEDPPFSHAVYTSPAFFKVFNTVAGAVCTAVDAYALGVTMLQIILGSHAREQIGDLVAPIIFDQSKVRHGGKPVRIASDCVPPYSDITSVVHEHRIEIVARKYGLYIALCMLLTRETATANHEYIPTTVELYHQVLEADDKIVYMLAFLTAIQTKSGDLVTELASGDIEYLRSNSTRYVNSKFGTIILQFYGQLACIFNAAARKRQTTILALVRALHDTGAVMLLHPHKPTRVDAVVSGKAATHAATCLNAIQKPLHVHDVTYLPRILDFNKKASTLQMQARSR